MKINQIHYQLTLMEGNYNMKFSIKGLEEKHVGTFEVEIEFMYGDADGYEKIKVGGFKKGEDEEKLSELIQLLSTLQFTLNHERSSVKGFDKWFGSDSEHQWLTDPFSYEPADLEGYKVYYYGPHNVRYEVEMHRELYERLSDYLNEWSETKPEDMTPDLGAALLETVRDIVDGGEF
ncbi:hypothetical protein HWC53_gp170 [Bacillus phage vB_BmeM-Goe8]|uniref:Uncharacterized protein n=1 Tax=Bacillus phage vB_BmeM-Goe8 TaxID=2593638 RepID=A0A516KMU6_9CAUD|nr:hypothetical protein HWC53_gp170 [Bacillus phage vB_BmeM-Goe8]QDP42919.1 hypothetical protein Goe8_c01460 [Bacillus phage vB_BmeM-Goe8]